MIKKVCPLCGGLGYINQNTVGCPLCGKTGKISLPTHIDIKEGIATTTKKRYIMVIASDDYYKSYVDYTPWILLLPPHVATEEMANQVVKDVARQMHLKHIGSGYYESLEHNRYDRGQFQGKASYQIEVQELSNESVSDFVSEWLKMHPTNKE